MGTKKESSGLALGQRAVWQKAVQCVFGISVLAVCFFAPKLGPLRAAELSIMLLGLGVWQFYRVIMSTPGSVRLCSEYPVLRRYGSRYAWLFWVICSLPSAMVMVAMILAPGPYIGKIPNWLCMSEEIIGLIIVIPATCLGIKLGKICRAGVAERPKGDTQ